MSVADHIVPFEELQRRSGVRQAAAVERWAQREGIRYFHGGDGIWTTLEALNAALGVLPANDAPPPLSPDLVG